MGGGPTSARHLPPTWPDTYHLPPQTQINDTNIAYICVPESLTHIFQLGIIAAIKSSIMRRKDDFFEGEAATAIREGRVIQLSKSRPVLRDRVVTWMKELLADRTVCGADCCRIGFDRAGITAALYNILPANIELQLVAPSALPFCEECGEMGSKVVTPDCEHFVHRDTAILCKGCVSNHISLCEVAQI